MHRHPAFVSNEYFPDEFPPLCKDTLIPKISKKAKKEKKEKKEKRDKRVAPEQTEVALDDSTEHSLPSPSRQDTVRPEDDKGSKRRRRRESRQDNESRLVLIDAPLEPTPAPVLRRASTNEKHGHAQRASKSEEHRQGAAGCASNLSDGAALTECDVTQKQKKKKKKKEKKQKEDKKDRKDKKDKNDKNETKEDEGKQAEKAEADYETEKCFAFVEECSTVTLGVDFELVTRA